MAEVANTRDVSTAAEDTVILLVDDNPSILEGVADLLDLYGYTVDIATDGHGALEAMQRRQPDLVISDIMMPGMDGYEFFKTVRSNPEWVPIPFIFLTARGQQTDIRRGHSLGADAYLTKPFEPEDLLIAIEGRLKRVRDIHIAARSDIDRMKQQLITIFSHELRTPLTYIYGYVNLLRDQHDVLPGPAVNDMLDGIQRGAERLTKLVEDLMLMVRIDSGVVEMEIALQQAPISLRSVFENLKSRFEAEARERAVVLEMDAPADLNSQCTTLYVQDALARLVDNAIKFCRRDGGIVRLSATAPTDGKLILAVQDNGIGIDKAQQQAIFESFQQADRDIMEQQGLGLGLTLAQSLVALHGGSLSLESEPGVGSRFTVTLPYTPKDCSKL